MGYAGYQVGDRIIAAVDIKLLHGEPEVVVPQGTPGMIVRLRPGLGHDTLIADFECDDGDGWPVYPGEIERARPNALQQLELF